MRSNISLHFFFIVVSMDERVQNDNQILRSLEMVLDLKEVMNSFSGILQDGNSGALSLVKKGSGKMTLSGANTFSGNTTLDEGSLEVKNAQALGTGSLSQTDGSSSLIFDTTGTVTNDLSIFSVEFLQDVILSGNIIANNATYDVADGVTAEASGDITGTGGTTKIGLGTQVLSGNNTYTGANDVQVGTLRAGSTTAFGDNVATTVDSGAVLELDGFSNSIGSLAGAGTVENASVTAATLTTGADNTSTTFSGILQDGAGGGTFGLTKVGTGTMTLTGANQHTGTTTLNAGTLVLGNVSAAGTGTISQTYGTSLLRLNTTGTVTNAMSLYNVESLQDVTLSGNITANNTTYDIATGTTTTLSGDISGSGGVTKEGLGTLVLEGTNTYTGTTDINAGTLLINASNAGAIGDVNINSGGTLGGTGSIGGATTLDSGGFLSPGDGGTGDTLSFLSSLDIQNASAGSLLFDLGAAGTGDTVNVTGQLSIGDGLLDLDSFAFTDLGVTSVTGTYTWNLFNVGSYNFTTLGSNTTSTPFASIKSASLAISGDFIQLTMTVPEPSSTALLGLGGIALMLRRKRS